MEELLKYILEGITGAKDIDIIREEEGDKVNLNVSIDKEFMGLVIGKGGKNIKAIQDILRIKGRLEEKMVFINIKEIENSSAKN